MHMNAFSSAQSRELLSEVTVLSLGKVVYEVPTLLQNRNNDEDHQKMVGVSRFGAPY